MSDFTAAFPIVIPPNTATPINFPCNLGLSVVETILVSVPPGCAGNVGFQIWAGGSPAYPIESASYFIFDDYPFEQDVSNQINSGQWAIVAYNTDTFQHTLQAYFKANYVVFSPSPSLSAPVSV